MSLKTSLTSSETGAMRATCRVINAMYYTAQ